MAASLVGTIQVSSAAAPGASYTPTNWQTPTAGNYLIMQVVCQTNSTSLQATISTPVGGSGGTWVSRGTGTANGTLSDTRTSFFTMTASGGDPAPSISLANMGAAGSGILVTVLELSGLVAGPLDAASLVAGSTSTANPLTISTASTAEANGHDLLVGFCSLMGTGTGTPTFTWGGTGTTFATLQNIAYQNSLAASVSVANTVTAGSYTATVTATSSAAQAASTIYFIGLKLANVTGAATLAETTVLGGATTASRPSAGVLADTSALGGAVAASLPAATALADTSALGGSAAASLPAVAGLASGSGLSGAATASRPAAAVMTQTSSLASNAVVALPVLRLTFAAPSLTVAGDTTIGLPLLELNFAAPALTVGDAAPRDVLAAYLYDRDGKTYLGPLPQARAMKWQEALSVPGPVSFEVPLDDASTALITDRRVVKLVWLKGGVVHARYGCRIDGEAAQLAVNGRKWVRFENQPGLMCFTDDGVVTGEYDFALNDKFAATRNYGYMSRSRSIWEIPGQFVTPQGMEWGTGNTTTNVHFKRPPEFSIDPDAMWISRINPNTSQAGRAANYFRTTFTVSEPTDIQILAAGDNYLDLFLDGQPIFTADYTRSDGWHTAQSTTTRVNIGTHELSARCENGPLLATSRNPVAFICTVLEVDRNGKKLSVITRSDNTTAWVCCDDSPSPGWGRAQILRSMILDTQNRGAYGPAHITLGFTYYHDSAGAAWTDHGNYVFDVATETMVDVIAQLCEADMDVTFDTAAMRLHAWKRAGRDRSSTVELKAGTTDASAKSYEAATTYSRFNAVYTQLSTGEWVGTTDPASISAVGRIERGISLGSTVTDPAALGVARQQINESSTPSTSITGQTSTLVGAQPYSDYFLGDTITVPNSRGTGTMKARVMAITVDGTGPVIQAYPELVQDKT